jgi:hypothetical protein
MATKFVVCPDCQARVLKNPELKDPAKVCKTCHDRGYIGKPVPREPGYWNKNSLD